MLRTHQTQQSTKESHLSQAWNGYVAYDEKGAYKFNGLPFKSSSNVICVPKKSLKLSRSFLARL